MFNSYLVWCLPQVELSERKIIAVLLLLSFTAPQFEMLNGHSFSSFLWKSFFKFFNVSANIAQWSLKEQYFQLVMELAIWRTVKGTKGIRNKPKGIKYQRNQSICWTLLNDPALTIQRGSEPKLQNIYEFPMWVRHKLHRKSDTKKEV